MSRSSVLVAALFIGMLFVYAPTPTAEGAIIPVGPGETHTTIGSAISAANPGDVIQVQPGTYTETGLSITDAITLESTAGPNTTEIVGSAGSDTITISTINVVIRGFTMRDATPSQSAIRINSALATVTDMRFTNNNYDIYCSGSSCSIDNITSDDSNIGIYAFSGFSARVSNLTFNNSRLLITLDDGHFENISINNSYITMSSADGNLLENFTITNLSTSVGGIDLNSIADNNIFRNFNISGSWDGVNLNNADDNLFENGSIQTSDDAFVFSSSTNRNRFDNLSLNSSDLAFDFSSTNYGPGKAENIFVHGHRFYWLDDVSGATVANITFPSTVKFSDWGPIVVGYSDNVTVENVSISNQFGDGISIIHSDNVTVKDTAIDNVSGEGLYVYTTKGGQVQNLTVINSDRGIQTSSLPDALIVRDSTFAFLERGIRDSGTSQGLDLQDSYFHEVDYPIDLLTGSNVLQLENNTFESSGNTAVVAVDCLCIIANNTINHTAIGVDVDGSSVVIRNNQITNSTQYGFDFDLSAPYMTFEGNTVDGYPIIYHSQDENITVRDLVMEGNGSNLGWVTLIESHNATVDNVSASANLVGDGFYFGDSNDLTIKNITSSSNLGGMEVIGGGGVISGIQVVGNILGGLVVESSNAGVIRNSTFDANLGNGLTLGSASSNWLVYNNQFRLNQGLQVENDGTNNVFYIDPATGPNIIGGPQLGGNFYSDAFNADSDGDGFSDIAHAIDGSSLAIDFYPLTPRTNSDPFASFAVTPNDPETGALVQFTDLSIDTDGSIMTWDWDFGDGTNSVLQHPIKSYASSGIYTVTLMITDSDGGQGFTSDLVVITDPAPPPQAPTASYTVAGALITNSTIQFISAASDPDGLVTTWLWDFGDGLGANSISPTHAYSMPGDYTVTLTVLDDDGLTDVHSGTVTITQAPPPPPPATPPVPSAAFTVLTSPSPANSTVLFLPHDVDPGHISSWDLDFGDGTSSTTTDPGTARAMGHEYTLPGSYNAMLTITAPNGTTNSSSASVQITVDPRSPEDDETDRNDTETESDDAKSGEEDSIAGWTSIQWGAVIGGFVLLLLLQMMMLRGRKPPAAADPSIDHGLAD